MGHTRSQGFDLDTVIPQHNPRGFGMAHAAVAIVPLMIVDDPGGLLIQLFLIPRRQGLTLDTGIDCHMNLFDR